MQKFKKIVKALSGFILVYGIYFYILADVIINKL